MRDYIRFLKYLKPHLWIMAIALFCMIISSGMGGVSLGMIIPLVDNILADKTISIPGSQNVPEFLLNIVDKVNSMPKPRLLNWLVLIVALIFLLKEAFLFLQTYFMSKLGQSVLRDVRLVIYKKLLALSNDFYSTMQTGELVSRITFDVGIIVNSITEGLTDLLLQPIQLAVYMVVLIGIKVYFSISWVFILITMLVFPLISYPVIKIGKKLRKISTSTQESMSDMNSLLFETIYGIGVVKSFTAEGYQADKFKTHNYRYFKMLMKSVKRMAIISPLGEFVGVMCMAIVLWFGGKEVVYGRLSAGAFIAFLAALLSLIKPFKRLSRLYGINQQAMAAIIRVFNIVDRDPTIKDRPGAIAIAGFKDSIEFNDIDFSYGQEPLVLKKFNVMLPKGRVLAIVGLSGAGKSTFVSLLPRFYDPTEGSVLIDGRDIRDFKVSSLRSQIGIVSQENILFNDSIRNNIAFGMPDADMEDIRKAAKAANAHDFIMKMPEGYETFIGDRGIRLSGGEKQRIAIARALFKDPPILILDEATSQLDSESEKLVQEAIDRLMAHRTVFVIAHRLSTVEHADKIIVLDSGNIVESGTHTELLAKSGIYKRLYEIQFKLKTGS
ncbi:MAG: ABC transporter ATP-binding protein/permease [Candidatus Omnitrophica bacterium]|nr:ABC transporter ATP-binding protein/permease [Candidatus Omnitrophota bacterium]